jgi:phage terminase large subunit GpA-like protein
MSFQTPLSANEVVGAAARSGARPDPLLTISQWSDQYRMLSQRASSEPGRWRTERTPYLREIMDCLSPTSPMERVIFMKGAQIGGTECGNNWIGYVIHQAPGPMMAVQPTVEMAKRNSKQRVDPLIEESGVLRKLVSDPRSRDSSNTVLSKEFPGGVLVMTGANSAVGLRSMAARYLFLDEVDGYPGDVEGEGDPVNLAMARTRTFARRKVFLVSTPKITGMSRIEAAYDESDRRQYYVPCPTCREFQVLRFSQLRWPKGQPDKAAYVCQHCGQDVQNHQKQWMLAQGQWRPNPPANWDRKTAGFHLSSLYSPVGWFSWGDAAKQFEQAQKNSALLQVFVNTVMGETWTLLGEAPDWKRLYERREQYKVATVPRGGIFLTAGADVQKDRIEVEIVAWGRGKESWSVDYRVFEGDTSRRAVWDKLTELLNETYPSVSGVQMPILQLAVDSGYATTEVYEWARRQGGRVLVIKGDQRSGAILGAPSPIDVGPLGGKLKRGVRVWPVNSGMAKEELYRWLRLDGLTDEELEQGVPFPLGYCHFPRYSEEYFKQITAEQLVTKLVKGYKRVEWQKMRERNEALDCRVYARAAAARVGIDRFQEKHWSEWERKVTPALPAPQQPLPQRVMPARPRNQVRFRVEV